MDSSYFLAFLKSQTGRLPPLDVLDSQQLQAALEVVDWPVNKDGRIGALHRVAPSISINPRQRMSCRGGWRCAKLGGPNSNKDIIQHWTRACDDLKGKGAAEEMHFPVVSCESCG